MTRHRLWRVFKEECVFNRENFYEKFKRYDKHYSYTFLEQNTFHHDFSLVRERYITSVYYDIYLG